MTLMGQVFHVRTLMHAIVANWQIQWRCGKKDREGSCPSLNFGLSGNCQKIFFLWVKFSSKITKFEAKTPRDPKTGGNIKNVSTHNLICSFLSEFYRNSVENLQYLSENCNFLPRR